MSARWRDQAPSGQTRLIIKDVVLDQLIADAEKRFWHDIGEAEAFYRTMPVVAAALGIIIGLVGAVLRLGGVDLTCTETVVLVSILLAVAATLFSLWRGTLLRDFQYPSRPVDMARYAEELERYYRSRGLNEIKRRISILRDIKTKKLDDFIHAQTHNAPLISKRLRWRQTTFNALFIGLALTVIFVVLVAF